MSANGVKTSEDADMADCDGEKVVTMMDVLQEQEDFEEDANAVLGASDDKNCTYSKGYVKRQAIYACLTCCPEAKSDPMKRAGVCLACSLACHENHELVELYTKRNFRCDCGNPKFTTPCTFTQNKSDLNYDNKYNQNFSGLYCICHRPYPDPEATEEEEMLQCIICEDWLHINHLEATVPHNDQYAEMICKDCMEDNDFLHDYSDLVVNVLDKEIIVTDPDFDYPSIKNKISKDILTNGTTETDTGKNSTENEADSIKSTSEDVNMTEVAKPDDTGDSTNKESQSEQTTDDIQKPDSATSTVDMEQPKPHEDGDNSASKEVHSEEIAKESTATGDTSTDGDKSTVDMEQSPHEDGDSVASKEVESEENAKGGTETGDTKPVEQTEDKEKIDSSEKPANGNEGAEGTESSNKDEKNEEDVKTDTTTTLEAPGTEPVESAVKEAAAEANGEAVSDKVDTTEVDPTTTSEAKTDTAEETLEKENESPTQNKRKLSTEEAEEDKSPKKPKLDAKPCIRPRGVKRVYKGATFWPENLRQKLCTCGECVAMYKDLAVLYLTDPDDTVNAYEALGKDNIDGPSSQYEKGLQALSSLDRVQQINALTEYNKMRDKLLDFLKSFKDRKEIVKEEDIKAFFAGMKPKREPDGVYFCR